MRTNKLPKKKKFSIVIDGETEMWYFQMMRKHENLPIDIEPKLPKKKKLSEQYEGIVSKATQNYDKIFWLIDLDTILKEDKETPKGHKKKSQALKEYLKKLGKHENVIVLINNPCLEFWLLLHYKATGKYFSACEDATKALEKLLPDYAKTEKYYTKSNNDLYARLKDKQNIAIQNAEKLGIFDFEDMAAAKAEIFKLVQFFQQDIL
jgi:RloB-like protein